MQGAIRAVPATQTPRLWLDIGTSFRTLTKWDLEQNASLVVVGVDPLRSNIEHAYQPKTPRFVRIHGACSESTGTATFYVHKSPTCGTLNPTRKNAPTVGTGNDACTGDVPIPTQVPTFPLRLLLRSLPSTGRIELLKIDVQGSELDCLRSAGAELRRVDNVLLEVQDAAEGSNLLMYEGAPTIPDLDALLASHGLVRQYCERNFYGKQLKEINCLYASTHPLARRLWATGNFQRQGPMVSFDNLPSFRKFAIADHLLTVKGSWPGERVAPGARLRPLSSFNSSAINGRMLGAGSYDWHRQASTLETAMEALAKARGPVDTYAPRGRQGLHYRWAQDSTLPLT